MVSRHFLIVFLCLFFTNNSDAITCSEVFKKKTVIENYLDLFDLPKQTIPLKPTSGIEVEAMIPKEIGMQKLAEATYEHLTNLGYEVTKTFQWKPVNLRIPRAVPIFGLTWKNARGEEYTLKVMQDYSISPELGYRAVEVVSPILRNRKDTEEFFDVIEMMRGMGLKQEVNRAGVHVHVGVPNLSAKELGMIGWTFSLLEGKFREMINLSSFRETFVNKQPQAEVESFQSLNAAKMSVKSFLEKFYPENKSRYVGVNMAALKKFGTIEIRLFNSSVEPRVIRFAKHLSRKIIFHTRNKTPEFIEFIKRAEKEDFTLLELFEVLGMDVAKAKEVMEIMSQEKADQHISKFRMYLRTLRVFPAHMYMGFVKGVLLPKKAPEGWEEVPAN